MVDSMTSNAYATIWDQLKEAQKKIELYEKHLTLSHNNSETLKKQNDKLEIKQEILIAQIEAERKNKHEFVTRTKLKEECGFDEETQMWTYQIKSNTGVIVDSRIMNEETLKRVLEAYPEMSTEQAIKVYGLGPEEYKLWDIDTKTNAAKLFSQTVKNQWKQTQEQKRIEAADDHMDKVKYENWELGPAPKFKIGDKVHKLSSGDSEMVLTFEIVKEPQYDGEKKMFHYRGVYEDPIRKIKYLYSFLEDELQLYEQNAKFIIESTSMGPVNESTERLTDYSIPLALGATILSGIFSAFKSKNEKKKVEEEVKETIQEQV